MTVVYQGQLLAAIFDGYLDQISPSSMKELRRNHGRHHQWRILDPSSLSSTHYRQDNGR
jgi:hypothetical protein